MQLYIYSIDTWKYAISSDTAITLSIFQALQAYHLSTMGIHVDLKISEDSQGRTVMKHVVLDSS